MTEISNKMQETEVVYGHVMITPHIVQVWYGHVVRREDERINRRVLDMKVERMRARGRSKSRWSDCVTEDTKERNLVGTDARGRGKWRKVVMNVDPHSRGKRQRERMTTYIQPITGPKIYSFHPHSKYVDYMEAAHSFNV